ncbi:LlaJI family restriction endonuclease [Oxalobacteraceae bacterium R-40]|uniref:LlaJI family restriction endonuclease n=1 Tax=Keguizhuia sedimenti TaxID=3064264 RepID=A0ABU1BKF2_9BURK|nr:LlaJI family restriction endonuclease [Oxalobacteraceae bacterium R-40]
MPIYLIENRFSARHLLEKEGIPADAVQTIEIQLGLNKQKRDEPINFVGLIETSGKQFFALPKFCSKADAEKGASRLVVELMRKVAANRQATKRIPDAHLFDEKQLDASLSKVGIADFLLEDYCAHGLISIRRSIYKASNFRSPDWAKTIHSIDPIWGDDGPVYDRWLSRHSERAAHRQITEIHKAAISACISRYGELLGYPASLLPSGPSQSQSSEHSTAILRAALRRTYSMREINVLNALIAWLEQRREGGPAFFGTRYFEQVWETICANLLNDIKGYSPWADVMPFPQWTLWATNEKFKPKGQFELDALTELPDSKGLLLSDAKYYVPRFEKGAVEGMPGMEPLSKQLHYEELLFTSQAFMDQYGKNRDKLINSFIFPGPSSMDRDISPFGDVTIPRITQNPIICTNLNGLRAFQRYLRNEPFSHAELTALWDSINSKASV